MDSAEQPRFTDYPEGSEQATERVKVAVEASTIPSLENSCSFYRVVTKEEKQREDREAHCLLLNWM